ncbi:MAG TPA: hypothetical protein EYP21_02170 [Syntrophaceae bacterium]|nr:hypothetical protein [Syntrophaceae bacterium]
MGKIYKFPSRKKAREIKTQEKWGEELIRRVFGLRYHFDPEEETFVSVVRSCRSREEFNAILKMAEEGLRRSRDIYRQRMAEFKDKIKRATSSRSRAAYQGWLRQTEKNLAFTQRKIQWLENKLGRLKK